MKKFTSSDVDGKACSTPPVSRRSQSCNVVTGYHDKLIINLQVPPYLSWCTLLVIMLCKPTPATSMSRASEINRIETTQNDMVEA